MTKRYIILCYIHNILENYLKTMIKKYTVIIKNGKIIDGTGNPWYKADIGIINGRITKIGLIKEEGEKIIDASGLIISPGFIDIHNHSDLSILAAPNCESNIKQGITTAVTGNCGMSMAPLNSKKVKLLQEYLAPLLISKFKFKWNWETLAEYQEKIKVRGTSVNLAFLVGQGNIRLAVKGFACGKPSEAETKQMKEILVESLENGAFGMSSGLIYPPGCYSDTEELMELGKILKKYNRIYATHIRDEGTDLIKSIKEAIKIGEANGIPVEISHFKGKGEENWGKVNNGLKLMEEARERGVEVNCDIYPYNATSTNIASIFPIWTLENGMERMLKILSNKENRRKIKQDFITGRVKGNNLDEDGFDKIVIADSPLNKEYEGKSLKEIIQLKNRMDNPYDALFDLIIEIKGQASVVKFVLSNEDIKKVISHPLSMIGSDSSGICPEIGGKPHPRAYGTFPRVIDKYVFKENILRLEDVIRKMTSLPASKIRLPYRGLIKEGFWADVVIFDSHKIKDRSTFTNPHQYPDGIEYVLVNGEVSLKKGQLTDHKHGKILNSYRSSKNR